MSSSMSMRECFKILDLPLGSSPEDIRQAYRSKAKDCHPDKNPDDPEATARFQEISRAYQILQRGFDDSHLSDSDSDEEGFSLLAFLFMFERMVREERRREAMRREAMRREAMRRRAEDMNNLFSGLFFQPHMHTYEEDGFFGDYRFRQRNHQAESYECFSDGAKSRYTTASDWNRRKQSSPQVHTPKMQSTRHKNKYQPNECPASHTPHQPRRQPEGGSTRRDDSTRRWTNNGRQQTYQNRTPNIQPKKAPAYVVQKTDKMTKKQLLAQQSRRQREANEIGKELRARAQENLKLKLQMESKE